MDASPSHVVPPSPASCPEAQPSMRRVSFSDELGDLLAEDFEDILSSAVPRAGHDGHPSGEQGQDAVLAAATASSLSAKPTRGILRRPSYTHNDGEVRYESLAVMMGLLKCGHVFETAVPLPDVWKDDVGGCQEKTFVVEARVAEGSSDPDLHARIQADETTGDARCVLALSARRPGKCRGRLVVALTRSPTKNDLCDTSCAQKCLLSIQIDATIMQPNMGNPRLRKGIACLGEMEGYFDSGQDEPTASSSKLPEPISLDASTPAGLAAPRAVRSYLRL